MKILVTGAKGFVGRNLCSQLNNIKTGKAKYYGDLQIDEVFEYDLDSTMEQLDAWCSECDFVFNLAGVNRPQNPEEFMTGNFGFASTLLDTLKTQQEAIGGLRQKLHDNHMVKLAHQERPAAVEAQRRECRRWNDLHDLIGSADGKKYRNFVQVLTFEIMIEHANRQLRRMTDRYLLLRNKEQPLELDVIDGYLAGEVRSTKNLSGGESFIVSLALALGLSQMASKTVRVDSLFLDEGFGTLDEDTLDTALDTLAGLHRDGKLIGVISHVAALKERIGTQIQVTPKTGGRSVVSGPGCSSV